MRARISRHLASVLAGLDATLRGAPADLPFRPDADTLQAGAHFTFVTRYGPLDILDRPDGSPPYVDLRSAAKDATVRGHNVKVASLDHLIAMKEASGRTKDKLMATEYRVLSDELRAPRSARRSTREPRAPRSPRRPPGSSAPSGPTGATRTASTASAGSRPTTTSRGMPA